MSVRCLVLVCAVVGVCRGHNYTMRIFKREVLDENLQNYLTNFGYMPKSADGAFALRTEESVRGAIREMQQFAGIPVTGMLDERTVKLLKTPRCGLPDKETGLTSGRRKRYAIHGMKWPHTDLTWSLRTKDFPGMSVNDVRYVIGRALEVWSKHSRLTFTEHDSDSADILIYFYRLDHGDNFPFDGRGVILAHAFFPTGQRRSVDVHFDADENWSTSENIDSGTNLFNVAAHEIGHSLGLSHSNVEGALMYPWYSEMKDGFNYELPEDDRLAIQYLYGSRDTKQWGRIPQYHPPRTQPTTTTTTTTRPTTKHRNPYDPRNPTGRYPYDNPFKPMNPEKKPHYHKPHHRHPYYYTTPSTTTTKMPHRKHPHHRTTDRTVAPHWPKEYPGEGDKPPPPDTCDTSYDAVAVIRRELFIFKNQYFWRIGDNGLVTSGYPAEIGRFFRGVPKTLTHVDAVFERSDGNIVFFIGNHFYVFSGNILMSGYPKPLTELGLPASLKKIDGAMIWGHNGKTYFFSGKEYWRLDDEDQKVEKDYPRKMEPMWKGVGTDIDAVFQWKDGKTYFFKDKGFWKFNDLHMRVEDHKQKSSAPVWMGCKQNIEQNDLNQKLPYTSAAVKYSSTLTFIVLTLLRL